MPEAITGRQLFVLLAALSGEQLALPIMLDCDTGYRDVSGIEYIPEQQKFSCTLPAYLLLTRHDD